MRDKTAARQRRKRRRRLICTRRGSALAPRPSTAKTASLCYTLPVTRH